MTKNEIDSAEKVLNEIEQAVSKVEKNISYNQQKIEEINEDLRAKERANRTSLKWLIITSINCLFFTIWGYVIVMWTLQLRLNCFKSISRTKLSFIDFLRYSLTNITSFGSAEISPITTGAKLLVMSEHLFGMYYLIALFGGLIGLLVS